MMKKLYIAIATISIFLMMLAPNVLAQDTLTYTDDIGDVLDATTGDQITRPNIDIYIISASKEGKVAEVKLQLAAGGNIQNKVSIYYEMDLATDLNAYMAFYGGGEIGVTDQDDNEVDVISYSGVGANILTISFNLSSADEVLENLTAASFEFSVESEEGYYDEYPNQMEIIDVEILDPPTTGTVGKSIKFRGSTPNYTGSDLEWSWDFGDNDTSELKEPTHTFSEPGTYDVSLEVFDSTGLTYGFTSTTIVISGGSSNGGNNGGSEGSGSGLIVFIAIIIIVIVVVVAAVFFIRRR